MFLNNHQELRKTLLVNTKIEEILIFPSKLFPGISFGYSNLSIITFVKSSKTQSNLDNDIRIIQGIKNESDLVKINKNEDISNLQTIFLKQRSVLDSPNSSFILNQKAHLIINLKSKKLGDYAYCVTGIYSGDNKRYLGVLSSSINRKKDYNLIDQVQIDSYSNNLDGNNNIKSYIPIVKGNGANKYKSFYEEWYINWSTEDFNSYKQFKKARFQNSSYYFKKVIALPMVKSSKINAVLMNNRVFDQSIVGIFPKDEKMINFLLGFFNSDTFCKMIHYINPTANNSANYLKQVPILGDENIFNKVGSLVSEILLDYSVLEKNQYEINKIFYDLYGL
jgi:hypothetical protein